MRPSASAFAVLFVLAGLQSGPVLAEQAVRKVAIAQFGLVAQLDDVVRGLKQQLADDGYAENKNVSYDFNQVNFDMALVPQMLTKLRADKPDVLVAITTPVSQAARQSLKGSNIPIVFTAVTDPLRAKLSPSWSSAYDDITGASDMQDTDLILDFIKTLLPNASRLAVPYNPSEDNDLSLIDRFKKSAAAKQFTIVEVGIDNVSDIAPRVAAVKGRADVIYVGGSNLIQPALPAVSSTATSIGIPIVNSETSAVKRGFALAAYAVDHIRIGRETAKIVERLLAGEKPGRIPPYRPGASDYETVISTRQQKLFLPNLPAPLAACGCLVP